MLQWRPFELHTHTKRSDGSFSLLELLQHAKALGLDGIALTDHNTITDPTERNEACQAIGVEVIGGMEWTTFYGHILILNVQKYLDWRNWSRFDLQQAVAMVHDQGGLVGIAHPFQLGDPICTGGHWEYPLQDWGIIDYLEVWSGAWPSIRSENRRAFQWWTELLNAGYRLTAVSGRDWHHTGSANQEIFAVTYLAEADGISGTAREDGLASLRSGAVSVSLGPLLLLTIDSLQRTEHWEIGGLIALADRERELAVTVRVKPAAVACGLEFSPQSVLRLMLNSNLGRIQEFTVSVGAECHGYINTEGLLWIRAELIGQWEGKWRLIAFTNPIYFEVV